MHKKLADLNNQTGLIRVIKPAELGAYVETQYRPAVLALQQAHQDYVSLQDQANEALRQAYDEFGDLMRSLSAKNRSLG